MRVNEEAATARGGPKKNGAATISFASDAAERSRVWEARRAALAALSRVKPTSILEDVTVPLPALSQMIAAVERIAKKRSLVIGTFGHAGDGNLHPTILTDERDPAEMTRVEEAIEEIMDTALALGGTISGEHGIGLGKSAFLSRDVGAESVEIMRRIKRAFDPNNILNPGKFV